MLPNIATTVPKGPIPVFRPYFVDRVMGSFARAGTPLYDLFGAASRRLGSVILQPSIDGVALEVVILATEAKAAQQARYARYAARHVRSSKEIMRDGNLVVLYSDRATERARLSRARRILDRTCR